MVQQGSNWVVVRHMRTGNAWYAAMHRLSGLCYFLTRNGWEARALVDALRRAERKLPVVCRYDGEEWTEVD